VDGAPLVWSFSQRECQDIFAKQTARDGSKKAPALSSCENALTVHHTITKAIKDKARDNVPKSKVKSCLHHVHFWACSLLYFSLLFIRSRVLVFFAPAPTLLSHILCPSGCLGLRFGDSTANLCSLSPLPPPLFQSVTPPIPSTVSVQTQTGLRIRSVSNVHNSCKAGSWMVSR